jgi:transcriptional regulator with XRE-family HTH domain
MASSLGFPARRLRLRRGKNNRVPKMHFGEFLQRARQAHEISLHDLSKRAGLDRRQLHFIETGEKPPPSTARIRALYQALGMDYRSSDVLKFLAHHDADERLIHLFLSEREWQFVDFALAAHMTFPGVPAMCVGKEVWRKVLAGLRAVRKEAEGELLKDKARKERSA